LNYEVKYEFSPLKPVVENGGNPQITFEYEYNVRVRAYGETGGSRSEGEHAGVVSIVLKHAPFSQYALFRSKNRNQKNWLLVFAGGNTSSEIQELFNGPVHLNDKPYFFGHPTFGDSFTSTKSIDKWWQGSDVAYECCAVFKGSKQGGVKSIKLPTDLFNTLRLAAADPSSDAATNTSEPSEEEIAEFLMYHAEGILGAPNYNSVPSEPAQEIPNGIYLPVDSATSPVSTGGIYVQGDAKISLNVVQGKDDFPIAYWTKIPSTEQSCKFQKIHIDHLDSSVNTKDIYIGDDPCNVTYIFNADDPSQAPKVLSGRTNGSIYVEGKIDELGGESRNRPAIAADFGFTITAKKDIRIINDIQYEDASYVAVDSEGEQGDKIVANAYGEVNGSGYSPADEKVAPQIDEESKTVLGIISTHRNVLIHNEAPPNLNIHGSLYAGNSHEFDDDTGLGCGHGRRFRGCGFGYEGWESGTDMGSFKLLGTVAEYRSQTMGQLSVPPTGYRRIMNYDKRFRQSLSPPAYPISTDFQAYPVFQPIRTLRIAQSNSTTASRDYSGGSSASH